MPIDVSILSQFKPQQPEPLLNTLAQFETIRGARQQQEMNALQMQQARRQMEEQEFENKLYQNALTSGGDVDYAAARQRAAAGGFGRLVPVLTKREQEEAKARAAAIAEQVKLQAEQNKLLTDKITQYGDAARFIETPEAARAWNAALHEDGITGPWFKSIGVTREQGDQEILAFAQAGDLAGWRSKVLEGKEKITQRLRDQSDLQRAMAAAGKKASPTTDVSLYDTGEEGRRVQTDSISYIQNVVAELQELGRTDLAGTILKQYMDSAMALYAGLPPGAAELEALRRHPELRAVKERLAELSAPKNVINVAGEHAAKKFIDTLSDEFEKLSTAPAALSNLERAKKLIPGAKPFLGSGAEAYLNTAKFLNSWLGMNFNVKGVKDAEVLRTRLFEGVMDNLKKLDAQPTERQQEILMQALGNLSTDPSALADVIKAYEDRIRERVQLYNSRVESAEQRGVLFPYEAKIRVPSQAPVGAPELLAAPPATTAPPVTKSAGKPPPGIPQKEWDIMDEEDRALWRKAK